MSKQNKGFLMCIVIKFYSKLLDIIMAMPFNNMNWFIVLHCSLFFTVVFSPNTHYSAGLTEAM